MKPLFNENRLSENIDGIASYDLANKKIFGSAYFVYHKGNVIKKCYGTRSLDSDSPITDTTLFRLASMTKPITAVATMILVERGLLSLDDTLDRFIPEFKEIKIIDAFGNTLIPQKIPTIKNILTHTSGIWSDSRKQNPLTVDAQNSLNSAIAFYIQAGLDFEPDSMQMYSGTGAFDVLTKIIELVTEMDYLDFLKKEIFEPCEMCDTTFIPTLEQKSRMVGMHDRKNGENTLFEMPENCVFENIPCTHYLGGAGLVSTLRDYCNFAEMLLHYGQAKDTRILSEASVRLMSTPHVYMREIESWGLGMRVITSSDTRHYLPIGSFGWSGAYGSHFWIDPSNDLFAVFMKNSKIDGGAGNESAQNFEKAVYTSSVEK